MNKTNCLFAVSTVGRVGFAFILFFQLSEKTPSQIKNPHRVALERGKLPSLLCSQKRINLRTGNLIDKPKQQAEAKMNAGLAKMKNCADWPCVSIIMKHQTGGIQCVFSHISQPLHHSCLTTVWTIHAVVIVAIGVTCTATIATPA